MSVKCIPLIHHFYIVKVGFIGVWVYMGIHVPIFLSFNPKHRLWLFVRIASVRRF